MHSRHRPANKYALLQRQHRRRGPVDRSWNPCALYQRRLGGTIPSANRTLSLGSSRELVDCLEDDDEEGMPGVPAGRDMGNGSWGVDDRYYTREEEDDEYFTREEEGVAHDCKAGGNSWISCTSCWIERIRRNGATNNGPNKM